MLSDLPGILQGVCESWGWSSDLQFCTGHQTHLSGTIHCLDSAHPLAIAGSQTLPSAQSWMPPVSIVCLKGSGSAGVARLFSRSSWVCDLSQVFSLVLSFPICGMEFFHKHFYSLSLAAVVPREEKSIQPWLSGRRYMRRGLLSRVPGFTGCSQRRFMGCTMAGMSTQETYLKAAFEE